MTNGWLSNIQPILWPKTTVTNKSTWLNQLETNFVQTSVNRRASVLRGIVGMTTIVMVALTGLTIFAEFNRRDANEQRDNAISQANARATEVIIRTTAEAVAVTREAERADAESTAVAERDEAQHQARNSRANQLAIQAQSALENDEDPSGSLALLLAQAAIQTNLRVGDPPTSQAIETLRLVVGQVPPYVMSVPVSAYSNVRSSPTWSVYNHDGTSLAISKGPDVDLIDPQTGKKTRNIGWPYIQCVYWPA